MPTIRPKFLPCGDTAVTVEFGTEIDDEVNALCLAFDQALADAAIPGVVETLPTYRSVMVQVDPLTIDMAGFEARVLQVLAGLEQASAKRKRWRIPVVYGGEFGIDLEDVAAKHGLTPNEVIRRHSERIYPVAMLGFLPGFAYLSNADQTIALPRRVDPRLKTPAGSVSIGGIQALFASVEAPSGWHLLGRTPVRNFMPDRDPVFLVGAGEEVVFQPIDASRWDALDAQAAAGEPVAEIISP
ncbi:5-oxoprolinase subunit PxpB [Phreatobacter aquaticus]|uniref:5-oxoprolinase subunit PxpB n=1 Tax=Phreatobacter aquaticus TaxID=2570229 RepID=A0A4D7QR66_9HYPH|nr:5-oxoprolinase subunit PxpB [Phreatobacter aquaticus]QCK88483.1 5-oxoprolinase subunit PxpB [Phreatobacter aquaticus]